MTTTKNPVDIYRAARADGKSQSDACRALIAAGIDFDDAAEMCWQIETGKPMPKWQHEDGSPTDAALAWDRGACREHEED
jgi:hypothetical protein